jgi:hypothetical protein
LILGRFAAAAEAAAAAAASAEDVIAAEVVSAFMSRNCFSILSELKYDKLIDIN